MADLSNIPTEKLIESYHWFLDQKMKVETSLYPKLSTIEFFDLKAWQYAQEIRRRKEGSCQTSLPKSTA